MQTANLKEIIFYPNGCVIQIRTVKIKILFCFVPEATPEEGKMYLIETAEQEQEQIKLLSPGY